MCEEITRMIDEGCPNVDDQEYSDQMHREDDPHYLTDDDLCDRYDDESYRESIGSCDWCGGNLYEEDDPELCDQCLWASENGAGSQDIGSSGWMPMN